MVQKIVFFMKKSEKIKGLKILGLNDKKKFLFDNFD